MINLLNNGNIETEGGDGVGKEGLALCTCIEGINIQKKMTHKRLTRIIREVDKMVFAVKMKAPPGFRRKWNFMGE